jgi:hypothetical protein
LRKGQKSRDWRGFGALHILPKEKNMNMQTVALSSLEPGRGNPRKAMDRRSLEGLAASIRNDGLLQNLVVSPVKGKGQHYRIVSGERRFRALKLLQERGDLDEDFAALSKSASACPRTIACASPPSKTCNGRI